MLFFLLERNQIAFALPHIVCHRGDVLFVFVCLCVCEQDANAFK